MTTTTFTSELEQYLRDVCSWNGFAHSLISQYDRKGSLSPKQIAAAQKMKDKADTRAQAKEDNAGPDKEIGEKLHTAFNIARGLGGLKQPRLVIGDINLSIAGPNAGKDGANAGMIYVKYEGSYKGKIALDGTWHTFGDNLDNVRRDLKEIADDPFTAAINHGKETGKCACCNATLTDPNSIERGIGPVCAQNWGWV